MSNLESNVVTYKASFLHFTSLSLLLLLAIFSIFPPARAITNFREVWIFCVIGWYIVNLLYIPSFLFKPFFFKFSIFFFIIYTVAISYSYGHNQIGNRFFEISEVFIFYMAFLKNRYLGRNKDSISILKIITPFYIYTSIITIIAYRSNPYISRGTITDTVVENQALLKGVGDYAFIYFLVIIFAIFFNILFYRKYFLKFRQTLLLFLLCILFAVNIILSNFTIAFLLLGISIFMIIIIRKFNLPWMIIYVILIILIFIYSKQYIVGLLDFLTNLFGEMLNASRMTELNNFISQNEEGNSIEARFYTYNISIEAFLQNPTFGAIKNHNLYHEFGISGFGQHSQILDCFALFGFIIGTLQLYLFFKPFIIRMRTNNNILKKLTFSVLTVFILLITFNNITPSIGFAAFFIFPTLYDWMDEKIKLNSKTN